MAGFIQSDRVTMSKGNYPCSDEAVRVVYMIDRTATRNNHIDIDVIDR